MKKILSTFIFLIILSCDDGDIIVTSFEFDDVDLQLCEGSITDEFVFFKINTSVNEAIAYRFINDTYSQTSETENDIIIDLNTDPDNNLIYRQFNSAITADYYCSNIPDSSIGVTDELIGIGGQAVITNVIVSEDDNDGVESTLESPNEIDPEADPDGDGVPNYLDDDMSDPAIGNEDATADSLGIEAGYNSDEDQIPDFRDQDDDNDNVLTSVEFRNTDPNSTELFEDSDGDGVPNFKDIDDDGDGIYTINEDVNGDGDPRNDDTDGDGLPNYLDEDDDGDGINTIDENANPDNDGNPVNAQDTDGDGFPDYLDDNTSDPVIGQVNVNDENLPVLDNTVITVFRTTVTITNLILNEENDQFTDDNFSFGFRDETVSITTPKND
ncbi:hypothetical protein [uncultured Aquimarina sp.]|uniref:hypothetical protein n=1 Tax=uncultured Aquimarina sp. TaxID=575652 RepID=UPI00262CCA13|nr:hypothetical protein [uncultured Aquimarina sp.]